ncbi:hypothetical protein PTT73_18760 [Serratia ureilytica]|uniref:hypothetical protein n=1 Tax=Serratia ureilytica TaxID=300181 RepID=UPI00313CF700
MDKFREPEQFDAEVEIHDGEPFAVWAPAVNGSHVKAEVYFALLAELEAKDERIGELEEQSERIKKELHNEGAANAHAYERIRGLEKQLATPVQSPDDGLDDCRDMWPSDCSDDFDTGYKFGLWRYEQNIRAAGFKIEGEE